MTPQQKQILDLMNGKTNAFENMADNNQQSSPSGATLINQPGNPAFKATFNVQYLIKYFSYNAGTGVFTSVAAAAMPASLQQTLYAFMFGAADFASGWLKMRGQNALVNWVYKFPFGYGALPSYNVDGAALTATVTSTFNEGDIIQPYRGEDGGTIYYAFVITRSKTVPMTQIMKSTESDILRINGIRYSLSDKSTAALLQFNNQFGVYRNNFFGALTLDTFDPKDYLQPSNQQDDVLDLPYRQVIDKYGMFSIPLNYDRVAGVTLSIFVDETQKIVLQ
jgi:hypothetical protein